MVAMFVIGMINFGSIMHCHKIYKRSIIIPDNMFVVMVDQTGQPQQFTKYSIGDEDK